MDNVSNPYDGTRGARPRRLVGRSQQLAMIDGACQLLTSGGSERPIAIAGLQGMGVSSVLHAAHDQATARKWMSSVIAADNNAHATVATALKAALATFEAARPGFAKLAQLRDVVAGYDAVPTDDAEHISDCLVSIGAVLEHYGTGLVCFIDDAHQLGDGLGKMATGITLAAAHSRPATMVLGGLPAPLPGFNRIDIGPIGSEQVESLLVGDDDSNPEFHRSAIARIQSLSRGVPFLVQAFAQHAWTASERLPVVGEDVDAGRPGAQRELVKAWYEPKIENLNGGARRYIRTVADLGGHDVPIAEVARRLGDTTRFSEESSALTQLRQQLMAASVLWTVDNTRVSFAIPEFAAYVRSSL